MEGTRLGTTKKAKKNIRVPGSDFVFRRGPTFPPGDIFTIKLTEVRYI